MTAPDPERVEVVARAFARELSGHSDYAWREWLEEAEVAIRALDAHDRDNPPSA